MTIESNHNDDEAGRRSERGRREVAPECEGLGPLVGPNKELVGYREYIHGPGSVLTDFRPTRAELRTLAYDYLERCAVVSVMSGAGHSGSSEWREQEFTWKRFLSIASCLNPDGPDPEFQAMITRINCEVAKAEDAAAMQAPSESSDDMSRATLDAEREMILRPLNAFLAESRKKRAVTFW